jgi:LPXTG-site transpeptidase (sortase) family protein
VEEHSAPRAVSRRGRSIEARLPFLLATVCFAAGAACLAWPAARVVLTGYATATAQAEALAAWDRRADHAPSNDSLVLEIPRLGLRRFVPDGATIEHLRQYGLGHISWTSFPPRDSAAGDAGGSARGEVVAIAGHRTTYGAPFYRLDDLRRGDKIVLRYAGRRYTYLVDHRVQVRPGNTGVLAGDAGQVALVTCSPPYSAAFRLVVFGRLAHVATAASSWIVARPPR